MVNYDLFPILYYVLDSRKYNKKGSYVNIKGKTFFKKGIAKNIWIE